MVCRLEDTCTAKPLETRQYGSPGRIGGVFHWTGAIFCTLVTTDTGLGFGVGKLVGGLAFSLGLILVVVAGAELFTGNCLIVAPWLSTGLAGPHSCVTGDSLLCQFAGALILVAISIMHSSGS